MKRCIVHIGMQKTGSASIQRSLERFADDHFFYARLDHANHGPATLGLFAPDELRRRPRHAHPETAEVAGYAARVGKALDESIAAAGDRTLLISGESMSVMPASGLERMRDYLRARFDEVTIVAYVRPPGALMSSRFQQRVKSGALKRFAIDPQYHHYRRIFSAFDGIFGRDRVRFWKFDSAAFPSGCVVRDFCSRLEIKLPADRIVRLNESLTRHAVSLIYMHRSMSARCGFSDLPAREAQRLGDRLAQLGGEKFRFSPDVIGPVLARRKADIDWMEERLGQSLHEELGTHRPGDVRSEADLLNLDPAVVGKLIELTGTKAPAGNRGASLEEVARLVEALRERRAARATQPEPA